MRLAVLALAAALGACQAVPDVTYAGALDGAVDGGNTCPETTPSFATTCCGPVPCAGPNCNATSCASCQSSCKLDELCCPNTQLIATCKPVTSPCQ